MFEREFRRIYSENAEIAVSTLLEPALDMPGAGSRFLEESEL